MPDDLSVGQNGADHLPVYTDDHLRVFARLAELGGAARYADLAAVVSQRAIAAACRDGVLVHLGRDRYVDPGVSDHLQTAIGLGGVLSHLSAAAQHGWSLKSMPVRPHVTVRPNRHLPRGRFTAARVYYRAIGEEHIIDSVTEPLRTVLDCARDLPFDEALTVADSASANPLESVLRPAVHLHPGHARPGLGAGQGHRGDHAVEGSCRVRRDVATQRPETRWVRASR